MTSSGRESTEAEALRAAAPPQDDIVAASARARVAASLFPTSAPEDRPVTPLLGGRYEVSRKIGAGGMGVVYEAFDPQLQRKVAVKVLHPEVAVDDKARKRMLREARALARLAHPNVIGVHDVGEADDQVFVAMELVEGPTLRAWTEAAVGDQPPVSSDAVGGSDAPVWQRVLQRYVQAGRGLAAAHHAGLVHRDFKPDNALVGADGRVRVLDFGLARRAKELTDERSLADLTGFAGSGAGAQGGERDPTDRDAPTDAAAVDADDPTLPSDAGGPKPTRGDDLEARGTEAVDADADGQLTAFGAVVGTPRYMAPEQFNAGIVDAASDQFSFCVSLYEALYRQRPFRAASVPLLATRVTAGKFEPAPRNGDVPDFVADAIERGLSPGKSDRWPDMDALLEVLEQAIERPGAPSISGLPVEAPPVPVAAPTRVGRGTFVAWAVAGVALAAAAGVWWMRDPGDGVATQDTPGAEDGGLQPVATPTSAGEPAVSDEGRVEAAADAAGSVDLADHAEGDGGGVGQTTSSGAIPSDATADGATDAGVPAHDDDARDDRPRRAADVCHMHEDKYRLLHRGKRRSHLSSGDQCLKCRRETSKRRIATFHPSDCQAYMVCGPVSSDECL